MQQGGRRTDVGADSSFEWKTAWAVRTVFKVGNKHGRAVGASVGGSEELGLRTRLGVREESNDRSVAMGAQRWCGNSGLNNQSMGPLYSTVCRRASTVAETFVVGSRGST